MSQMLAVVSFRQCHWLPLFSLQRVYNSLNKPVHEKPLCQITYNKEGNECVYVSQENDNQL